MNRPPIIGLPQQPPPVGFMLPNMLPLDLCEVCVTFGETEQPDGEGCIYWKPLTPAGNGWSLVQFQVYRDASGDPSCAYLWARAKQARTSREGGEP